MKRIFQEHKRVCMIIGVILAVIVLEIYLYAFFQTGVWHRDAFLYKQSDGSFIGSDSDADYEMYICPTDKGAEISFAANGTVNQYQIFQKHEIPKVEIYKNDKLVFKGSMVEMGDTYMCMEENGNVLYDIQRVDELFPDYGRLYAWAVAEKYDFRGNIAVLLIVVIFSIILILDIVFPNFFFLLHHGLAVQGGEPSDWYRAWQRIGQVIIGIGIIICIMLSFKRL